MGFVTDDQVPICNFELILQVFIAGELIEPDDAEILLSEDVTGHSRFEQIVGKDFEFEAEFAIELVLPLFCQAARADNHAALEVAPYHQFFNEEPGHNGFTGAGIIGEDVAQRQAG